MKMYLDKRANDTLAAFPTRGFRDVYSSLAGRATCWWNRQILKDSVKNNKSEETKK